MMDNIKDAESQDPIGRAARAAADELLFCAPWKFLSVYDRRMWKSAIVAALRELREPSNEMTIAGMRSYGDVAVVWREMLDMLIAEAEAK
jgi:hypothetical protein